MNNRYAKRIDNIKPSFLTEILAVDQPLGTISFAGGLPNPATFPVKAIAEAAAKELTDNGRAALQYTTTEGYLPLREFIAARYHTRFGIEVSPEEILITSGSQQGFDLLGKVFLDPDDGMIIESPAYLGAIDAYRFYEPRFLPVTLNDDGADPGSLLRVLRRYNPKLFYAIPNFQNPTGITYSDEMRRTIAGYVDGSDTVLVEDDPFGELRFMGEDLPTMRKYMTGDNVILLGTFSKIVAPGLRVGWICACCDIIKKLTIAKQAADLHASTFSQRIMARYLADNSLDKHIAVVRDMYGANRNAMVEACEWWLPERVTYTCPEGGMFLWVTLPKKLSAMELYHKAAEQHILFIPGEAFFVNNHGKNEFRLNFSNVDRDKIEPGIKRLGHVIQEMLEK